MNTKSIGNIGEAKVICKFVSLNIPVYIPFGDNEKSDLIAEFNGKLNKIQVKTSVKSENGKVMFNLCSSTRHRNNGINYIYTNKDIDYFACYNIARDTIYLIKVDEAPNTYLTIYYGNPLNNQTKNIRFEKDYLIDNILCVETLHPISEQEFILEDKDKVQTIK